MNLPRIYSLSTVGLLKHYVHDYLFHHLRTDFIGPNGVGKSIIADLLQLMFIYDSSLIKFGTDGVKKEDRRTFSLPHNINTGYCFLNLEVEKDKYLIIGIAISSHVSQRIIPFIISRTPEISTNFNQLYLTKNQLLTAKSFIDQKKVPDIKMLAVKLLEGEKLYLTSFRTRDDVKRYYQFLFDKEILSINLVVEENLQAFAKVIQSFSKAKSLDLSASKASKSLKEFLFEENESEFQQEYHTQQGNLERILRDYARLSTYIAQLTKQQATLSALKEIDIRRQNLYKQWKAAEIFSRNSERVILAAKEQELMIGIEQDKLALEKLNSTFTRLPAINKRLTEAMEQATDNETLYQQYKIHEELAEDLQRQVIELKILQAMKKPDWRISATGIDINLCSVEQIKELMVLLQQYQIRYNSFEEIEEVYQKQQNQIATQRIYLHNEKTKLIELISILENKTDDSVLGWVIGNGEQLTVEQRNILLIYATLCTKKKKSPQKGDWLANAEELMQVDIEVVEKNSGFWITLGPIKQFITYEREADLLAAIGNSDSIRTWLFKVRADVHLIAEKLKQLEEAAKGKTYNQALLNEEYDLFLMTYSNIERIQKAISCSQYLVEKMTQLTNDQENIKEAFEAIRNQLPKNILYTEPEMIKRELKVIVKRSVDRIRKYESSNGQLQNKQTQITNRIQQMRLDLMSTTQALLDLDSKLRQLRDFYFSSFHENLDSLPQGHYYENEHDLQKEYQQVSQEYILGYHNAVSAFDETRNSANLEINEQIKVDAYSFATLEKALLGPKVRYADNIGSALSDANRSRMSMADDLKSSMIKIFDNTVTLYRKHQLLVNEVNAFFQGRKISERFLFSIDFTPNEDLKIELVEDIGARMRNAARQGELPFEQHVSVFIEEFFQKAARLKEKPTIDKLLNPATYFNLSVSLTDDHGTEVPGSTGETYSAIALLGVARLSIVQQEKRKGLRFIILEELGSLDRSNFNTFPAIAKEFGYQIITMAPTPFRTALSDEWYAHHLIKGIGDKDINFSPSASYFKTSDRSEDLETYLSLKKNELG